MPQTGVIADEVNATLKADIDGEFAGWRQTIQNMANEVARSDLPWRTYRHSLLGDDHFRRVAQMLSDTLGQVAQSSDGRWLLNAVSFRAASLLRIRQAAALVVGAAEDTHGRLVLQQLQEAYGVPSPEQARALVQAVDVVLSSPRPRASTAASTADKAASAKGAGGADAPTAQVPHLLPVDLHRQIADGGLSSRR